MTYQLPEGKICVWGAGLRGRGIAMMLQRHGRAVDYFVDKHPFGPWRGIEVRKEPDPGDTVLVAQATNRNTETVNWCRSHGFRYIIPHEFCPYYPTIDVCTLCGLSCRGCSRRKQVSWMPVDLFCQVLDKMVREIPWLYMVDLYGYGDPFLNRDLPLIIRACNERKVGSGLSTSLQNIRVLRATMAERPTQIRVAISGFGENHEWGHMGSNWELYRRNLGILSECMGETAVELYFHVTKRSVCDWPQIKKMADELGFRPRCVMSMPFNDFAAEMLEGAMVPYKVRELLAEMLVPIEQVIEDGRAERHKNCMFRTAYPYVNPEGDVLQCCMYSDDIPMGQYLNMALDDIRTIRDNGLVCERCIKLGIHRYFTLDRYEGLVVETLRSVE